MEKICIVKLRKKMDDSVEMEGRPDVGNPAGRNDGWTRLLPAQSGMDIAGYESVGTGAAVKKEEKGNDVSLALTAEQSRTLRSNPYLLSFLNGEFAGELSERSEQREMITIKFELESAVTARLLTGVEVVKMLRISKGFLGNLVRERKLKSYKIGRLRRFMLDDVLTYLEGSQIPCELRPEAAHVNKCSNKYLS